MNEGFKYTSKSKSRKRMKLFELEDNDILSGFYNIEDDKMGVRHVTDRRKKGTPLMLRAINRLKKMRALKKLKDLQRQDLLGIIYGIPDEPAGGGGSPF